MSTLKTTDLQVDLAQLSESRIGNISDAVVKDLAEVSQQNLFGKLHIKVHFEHGKIVNKTIIVPSEPTTPTDPTEA